MRALMYAGRAHQILTRTHHAVRVCWQMAASWGPAWLPTSAVARKCKKRLLIWLICALSRSTELVDAFGLKAEREAMPWGLAGLIWGLATVRGLFVRWLLPPRPRSLAATILKPPQEARKAEMVHSHLMESFDEIKEPLPTSQIAFPCPHGTLTYRAQGCYRMCSLGLPPQHSPLAHQVEPHACEATRQSSDEIG